MSITFDDAHVLGSPKQISILINPLYMNINPLLSRAEGPALRGATAGAPSVFTVSLVTDSGAGYPTSADYRWTGLRPASRAGWRSGTSTSRWTASASRRRTKPPAAWWITATGRTTRR